MTTAAFSLLHNAATEREKWLTRFYEIGKEAVRPRKGGEVRAIAIDSTQGINWLIARLEPGGVEVQRADNFRAGQTAFPRFTWVVRSTQPYFSFAKTLL